MVIGLIHAMSMDNSKRLEKCQEFCYLVVYMITNDVGCDRDRCPFGKSKAFARLSKI